MGLFRNFELVTWLEPCEKPDSFEGFTGEAFYRLPPMELDLAEGGHAGLRRRGRRRVWPEVGVPLGPGYQVQDGGDRLAGGIGGLSEKYPGGLGPGVGGPRRCRSAALPERFF